MTKQIIYNGIVIRQRYVTLTTNLRPYRIDMFSKCHLFINGHNSPYGRKFSRNKKKLQQQRHQ